MLAQRTAFALRRLATTSSAPLKRTIASSAVVRQQGIEKKIKTFDQIKTKEDLLGPGAAPGTVPTDLEQATGLERLEILGKMEGIDIFDMKPLDASRLGTMEDPIVVQSMGEEQYLGCTGFPVDSHETLWLTVSKDRPYERCTECGSVYKMDYVGPEDHHDHDHHGYEEPKTWADYVRPEYTARFPATKA